MGDQRTAMNYERIVEAVARHRQQCPFPPYAIRMHPFDIDRLGWEEGETIAGLTLEADPAVSPEAARLVCERDEPRPHWVEEIVEHDREREEVLV